MDKIRAKRVAYELCGGIVGGWKIVTHIGQGKSAVVFRGEKEGQIAAIKVFDPEIVERYGEKTQLVRISRELLLCGHDHGNLVTIFDGGKCDITNYCYLAMEYIPTPNLEDLVPDIPAKCIWTVINQIASAAQFLEIKELVHRDIKPSNIATATDFSHSVLLDLGVLKPVILENITDQGDNRSFIGTLRYSSPEFLKREEDGTVEGWRALTFYQLGAVLHDMIMRKPLFQEFTDPYAKLVTAIEYEIPHIESIEVDKSLLFLARNCLTKDPKKRLEIVSWDDFKKKDPGQENYESAKQRIRKRKLLAEVGTDRDREQAIRELTRKQSELLAKIQHILHRECIGSGLFPPMEMHEIPTENVNRSNLLLSFSPSLNHNLSHHLALWFVVQLEDRDSEIVKVEFVAGVGSDIIQESQFRELSLECIFNGVFDVDVFGERINDFIYPALDAAQDISDPESFCTDNLTICWVDNSCDIGGG